MQDFSFAQKVCPNLINFNNKNFARGYGCISRFYGSV